MLLTLSWALPLAGAILLLLVPNRDGSRDSAIRWLALALSLAAFAVTLVIWTRFDSGSGEFQMVERVAWIPAFGIDYYVGIDGISLLLVVLTGFLTPIALLSSWEGIEKKVKEFSVFILALEAAMIGVQALRARDSPDDADVAVPGVRRRLRDQGAAVPIPHVAA
jgi:NADH-quinone oxidoreductase subunit M